ncbi:MAG TPA: hypothetical protein VFW64_22165 [Pseudonocardiaceae bacterium]|nr:hypothetical protein [Pseudonocardiaceae bacterium]
MGIDESEQMLQVAAERVAEHGWDNVLLLAAPVARAPIEVTADAALFCAVHDVLQSPAALKHILIICVPASRRPGVPVAAAGGKWPAPWLWPAGMGGRPARAVRQRFHRLRPALATVGQVRPRPADPPARLHHWIPRARSRWGALDTAGLLRGFPSPA